MKMLILTEVEISPASSGDTAVRQWIHHHIAVTLGELAADYLATTGDTLRLGVLTSDHGCGRMASRSGDEI